MTPSSESPRASQRQSNEVSEVLSLIEEEAGSATLVLIAVVTTPTVKLLEEKCRQLLPEQHIIITTMDQLPVAIERSAAHSPSAKCLSVLVSSRYSRVSLQVSSRFRKLALVPTGRRKHGLSLHVQEDSTFCEVPLYSWVNRTTHKNHEFIHREGICLVTGMARMVEQAEASTSQPLTSPLSEEFENIVMDNLERLGSETEAWDTDSDDTGPEKASDNERDAEKIDDSASESGVSRTEGISMEGAAAAAASATATERARTRNNDANSAPAPNAPFWETWKATIAAIIGALAGLSSGAAYLTMTVKGIYVNVAGFTLIAGKLGLTAACATAGISVGVGLVTAAAIYFIPWDRVFNFLGSQLRWLGEKLAAIWARFMSRFNTTQRRRRAMPLRI
ncbi:hypothetical protein BDZ45DRAFT_678334 [Acephala macrosclerotiorum]|nr:hypothetical protein BDZ45DRAFT_678334 [Acephala macrosclerotiorum]